MRARKIINIAFGWKRTNYCLFQNKQGILFVLILQVQIWTTFQRATNNYQLK